MSAELSGNFLCFLLMNRLICRLNPYRRVRLSFFSSSSSCSSNCDGLHGLVDPDCSISSNGWTVGQENKKQVVVFANDFAFLQEEAADCSSTLKIEPSEEAVLICEAIRSNFDDLEEETLKYLRQFRGKLDNNLVIEVLRLLKVPELGVKFISSSVSSTHHSCVNQQIYNPPPSMKNLNHHPLVDAPLNVVREEM